MDFKIQTGTGYSKQELEEIFSTNFGARIKGITLRRSDEGLPYAIIFSRADGPYSDRVEGNTFFYDGEGRDKDQELTAANKALVEANKNERTIFGFRQSEGGGDWQYLGILYVLDYAYVLKNGYKTYEFHLASDPVTPEAFVQAEKQVESAPLQPPVLYEESTMKTVQVRARSAAFRVAVKRAYDNICVVCGKKRFTVAGYPEVEAAHIFPKERQGADDPRNGITLCKLHHWSFDSGLWALTDDLRVIVNDSIITDENYKEIYEFAGKHIFPSKDGVTKPDKLYVAAHRSIHGFTYS